MSTGAPPPPELGHNTVPPHLSAQDLGRRLDPRKRLTRTSFHQRLERLRSRIFLIIQCAIGGALAWVLAHDVLDHPQPFFAPVTVIVALGLTYGQRLRRVIELTVGVAIGVFVGDVFVHVAGSGPVQIAFVVLVSMVLAVLAGAGGLMMVQAGVQSMIVVVLVAPPGTAFSRWLDALVGGAIALIAAMITPTSPIRRPRIQAAAVLTELADVLGQTATAVRRRDQSRADAALARARDSEALLVDLREATEEGIAVTRQSPFRRRHAPAMVALADLVEPLDRAIRNIRVLVRRAAISVWMDEQVPPAYLEMVEDLAEVMRSMAEDLNERRTPLAARPTLLRIGRVSTLAATHTSLSGEVIRAQVRSTVVDLLMLSGLTYEESRDQVPAHVEDLDD